MLLLVYDSMLKEYMLVNRPLAVSHAVRLVVAGMKKQAADG